ncbi:hypothetical protein UCRPC4_g03234 [Phaeomoniella chlamydospora]|uniref:CASTOR ACT domain-containing protein n=1 Tax=Phaeomoniella chlamydospora TaxID=158046 RepID=A0A0G2EID9_PHACM|nr:hypothetical protein UCRPC4_g03234 [Phaeomoniella chlamydospora]
MISPEDYVVIQVEGQGLDAGQRVLELTRPLAMAGISIFFKTTYFSDYILVPLKARSSVVTALEQRGFTFSVDVSAFMHQSQLSPPPSSHRNHRHSPSSSQSSGTLGECSFHQHSSHRTPPSTPPAANVHELQTRTFTRLRKNNITPEADRSIQLISCAGRKEETPDNLSKLKDDLLQCLISTCTCPSSKNAEVENIPENCTRFLSLTLTDVDPISLFIESRFVNPPSDAACSASPSTFHTLKSLPNLVLGSRDQPDDTLIPIILDLRELPLEATGIVCGVAATLSRDTAINTSEGQPDAVEISFLSTAKAGTVLVKENDLSKALGAMETGFSMAVKEMEQKDGGPTT